jgi:hypothetical protein
MDEIKAQIETLRAVVEELHKNRNNIRDESLLERDNMAEDADDKKKAKAIQQKKNTEQQARAFLKLKFKRGLIRDGGGISRLQVPVSLPTAAEYDDKEDYDLEDPKSTNHKDPSKWKEVNCPKEIEFLLRLWNQRHFGKAETDGILSCSRGTWLSAQKARSKRREAKARYRHGLSTRHRCKWPQTLAYIYKMLYIKSY